jgi:GT2 family glycosyltransferase
MVSILVLNCDGHDHLRKCLLSIQAFTEIPHELVIIDNGSSDGSVDFLRTADIPNLTLVENPENIGCPAGRAQGMALAQGDFVLFLDNDTIVTPGWLERLVGHCERFPRIGLIGPCTGFISGAQGLEDVRYSDTDEMIAVAQAVAVKNRNRVTRTDRLIGFCMLIRRAVIDKIGSCDARFGKYGFEDDDYTLRARLAGFEACIAQDVFIHHTGNQGVQGGTAEYRRLIEQAWQVFRDKWELGENLTFKEYLADVGESLPTDEFCAARDHIPLADRSTVDRLVTRRT